MLADRRIKLMRHLFNNVLYQVVTCDFFTVLQASEVIKFPDLLIVLFVEAISL